MLYEEFYHATNADLFLVAEGFEPSGELVGALNVPRHEPYYAMDSIMRPELYSDDGRVDASQEGWPWTCGDSRNRQRLR
jgi:hypothetical protein